MLRENSLVFRLLSVKNGREKQCTMYGFFCNEDHAVLQLNVGEISLVAVAAMNNYSKKDDDDIDEFFVLIQKGYRPLLDHTFIHYLSAQCVYAQIHLVSNIGQVLFLADVHAVCALFSFDEFLRTWKPLSTLSLSNGPVTPLAHFTFSSSYLCWTTLSASTGERVSKTHFAKLRMDDRSRVTCDVVIVRDTPAVAVLTSSTNGIWMQHSEAVEFFCANACRVFSWSIRTPPVLYDVCDSTYVFMTTEVINAVAYHRDALHHLYSVPLRWLSTLSITSFVIHQSQLVMLINNSVVGHVSLADVMSSSETPVFPPHTRRDCGGLFRFDGHIGHWSETSIVFHSIPHSVAAPISKRSNQTPQLPRRKPYTIQTFQPQKETTVINSNILPSYSWLLENRCAMRDIDVQDDDEKFEELLLDIFERLPLLHEESADVSNLPINIKLDAVDILDLTVSLTTSCSHDYLELLCWYVLCAAPKRLIEFLYYVHGLYQRLHSTFTLMPFALMLERVCVVCSTVCSRSVRVAQQHAYVRLCIATGDFTRGLKYLITCNRFDDAITLYNRLNAYAEDHDIPGNEVYTVCALFPTPISSQSFMGHLHTMQHLTLLQLAG